MKATIENEANDILIFLTGILKSDSEKAES